MDADQETVDRLILRLTDSIAAPPVPASAADIVSATFTLAMRTAMALLKLSPPADIEHNRKQLLLGVAQIQATLRAWPIETGPTVH